MPDLLVSTLTTFAGVALAVGIFAALWVAANLLFDQVTKNFPLFSMLVGGIIGAVGAAILDGNRLLLSIGDPRPETLFNGGEPGVFTDGLVTAVTGHLAWPLIGAAIGGALGAALARLSDRRTRLAVAIAFGLGVGLVLSFALKTRYELALRSTPLLVATAALTALGVGISFVAKKNLIRGGLGGAFIGWVLGAFGGGLHGVSVSNQTETVLAFLVAGALGGAYIGFSSLPDAIGRARIDDGIRPWLFMGPAVLFITVMLIVPTLQTVLLSLQEPDSASVLDGFAGTANYETVFSDPKNLNTDDLGVLFASEESSSILPWGGSALIPWVAFFALAAVVLAVMLGRESGQPLSLFGPPLFPLLMAITLFAFALFTHLRGTIINNVWWVVAVTILSTGLGLAIARLADGAPLEPVAKSLVFMPMAISMVGASIIWRLIMYQARNETKEQTGVFNAIWVRLGRMTTGDAWFELGGLGIPRPWALLVGGVFVLAAVMLFVSAIRAVSSSSATAGLYLVLSVVPLWAAYRTFAGGIGGFRLRESGEVVAQPVFFVQDNPYNSFWLMVIMIWIQTGFAMVILSAAIKAVPGEFLEAASLDGATEGQRFWRIVVPTIAPTIGVVATTIMVNVMKVFDIVKVTTNGQFDSQVLANAMYEQSFLFGNREVGAALAVMIFVGIFPVMAFNILRLTREEA